MTTISIRQDESGSQYILTGHADYAAVGGDIVCAGISVLTNTLCNLIQAWAEEGRTNLYMMWPEDEPRHIFVDTGGDDDMNTVLAVITSEYVQLSEQYPGNVKVEMI